MFRSAFNPLRQGDAGRHLARQGLPAIRHETIYRMRLRGARFETVTADNGTEFHDDKRTERLTGAAFSFARPYHSREWGATRTGSSSSTLERRR